MSTKSYRGAKKEKQKKERRSAFEHYIEALMREMIRKAVDDVLKDFFSSFR